MRLKLSGTICVWLLSIHALYAGWVFNNPYPEQQRFANIYYGSFSEQPKTLDPAKAYSANEYFFLWQIYETLFTYDYYQRPFKLKPLLADSMPEIHYYDSLNQEVSSTAGNLITKTSYRIRIKPNILYQPHPAFARNKQGQLMYHHINQGYLDKHDINTLSDFKHTGTRVLNANDFVYQIKRLANPGNASSVYGLMASLIVGFDEFAKELPDKALKGAYVDLRNYPMSGLRVIDDLTFEIDLKGQYPQFNYWLSMPFFSPMPWEADAFYHQNGMEDNNITLAWYPVGTGPFLLSDNNPNRQMVLSKNPNFREEYMPDSDNPKDMKAGFTQWAGKRIPFIDKAIFVLEKEAIPRWNKFLQGYYDTSGISSDSFQEAIQLNARGQPELTVQMKEKGMRLSKMVEPSIYYFGFNMLDPVVGGYGEKQRKLRQAISIAINTEEQIALFINGQGRAAHGPLPPGIFGYQEGQAGINPYVYDWVDGRAVRKKLSVAKQLLVEAGYPDGIDPDTKKPLLLHYDVPSSGGPDDRSMLEWMRKQLAKLNIRLNIRNTTYNRFQEKMRHGNAQIFTWGWNADYPDPENFLFLLYSANGKVKHGGENASNYENKEYDTLFNQMKNLPNGALRQAIINQMIELVRRDAPWIFGINRISYTIDQQWLSSIKRNPMAQNALKYQHVDVDLRTKLQHSWNQPVLWPLLIILLLLMLLIWPLYRAWQKHEYRSASRIS